MHHRLTPIEAARLGKTLEPYDLFWLEDPTPAEHQEGFRLIRQHTTTPLAVGEVFNTICDCQQLIKEQLIDYIRATVVHAGGITHLRKIADLAALYHVRTGCTVPPTSRRSAWRRRCTSTSRAQLRHPGVHAARAETDAVFPHEYTFDDGYLHPGDAPGLGVDLDETLAAQYPYEPAYLPVNRKMDGTMHDW